MDQHIKASFDVHFMENIIAQRATSFSQCEAVGGGLMHDAKNKGG